MHDTRDDFTPQRPLTTAGRILDLALDLLPGCGRPGCGTAAGLALDVAEALRGILGPAELTWACSVFLLALPPWAARNLIDAAKADLRHHELGPDAAEAERQDRVWAAYCRAQGPRRRPPLNRVQRQRARRVDLGAGP
jgi:hypothetical protein